MEVLAGTGYRPLGSAPLFYVYELPPQYNVWWVQPVILCIASLSTLE